MRGLGLRGEFYFRSLFSVFVSGSERGTRSFLVFLGGIQACWVKKGMRLTGACDRDLGVLGLFETGKRDVEIEADSFLPLVQPGSLGIRVCVYE